MASGRSENKFDAMGYTAVKSQMVDAPYADEIAFVLECKLIHTLEIGLHTLFVGEIADIKAEDSVLSQDGKPDILKIDPLIYDTAHRGYYGVGSFVGDAFDVGKELK